MTKQRSWKPFLSASTTEVQLESVIDYEVQRALADLAHQLEEDATLQPTDRAEMLRRAELLIRDATRASVTSMWERAREAARADDDEAQSPRIVH